MVEKLEQMKSPLGFAAQKTSGFQVKTETLQRYKQLKALALQGNAMAAYRLSKMHPEHSAEQLKWLKLAADEDLTNAMLDLAKALAQSNSITDLQEAANYLVKIFHSNDSFIKEQADDFLNSHRCLRSEVARQLNGNKISHISMNFFARSGKEEPVPQSSVSLEL
ncbi:hypothetical protein EAW55_11440 [Legionella jordanis]|uniref:Dot/Icm secretion system substrate n=2 Tax=Legionella jordanis TaxID=456 RepID=A0A0W0VDN3_9GAMM|nr:hypothetical protein [Legionella jordanis]KTD18226.1 Dot/Icm secretion system substrate [Legionella jordanis]RMX01184.1 hypothetical protein EAW55_11440 [Legionella jordanis]RMX21414.1 hypothetical protein EAS68_04405 [Legionella jordanis]VEH13681.1 Dot/Icm secretion system substrate [Legionella jordanis]